MANTNIRRALRLFRVMTGPEGQPSLDTAIELPAGMGTPWRREVTFRQVFEEYCSDDTEHSILGHESPKARVTYTKNREIVEKLLASQLQN